ncbi:type 2 periplasmic-binding domain-containing protein [Oceanobacillus sp. CAU 1775]
MKISKSILFSLMFAMILLVACGSDDETPDNAQAQDGSSNITEQKFRINAGLSSEDNNVAAFTAPWIEEVKNRTDGKITFDEFYSQELVNMGEEVRALKDGTIDIAAPVLPTYNPDQFPLSDITMLPLISGDSKVVARAFADLIASDVELVDGQTFVEYEYGRHGMKALPVQPIADYTIGFVTKDEIKSASDLQNLSLRTGGRAHEIFVSELGSGSVSMPWSEEFEALSRGAVDGNVRSVNDYEPYGFDELINQALEGISLGNFPFIWLMDEEKWNELPEELQTIMEDVAYELAETDVKLEAQAAAYDKAVEKGIKFVHVDTLDEDAQELLETASINTWHAWIESKEQEGHPGKEAAKLWRDLLIKHGGEVHGPILDIE